VGLAKIQFDYNQDSTSKSFCHQFRPNRAKTLVEPSKFAALFLLFPNDFRNQLLRTEHFETFSSSRLNRNNSLGYFRNN